jgi:two-component system cell cycle sensor histidine kinase/response regulator CckA
MSDAPTQAPTGGPVVILLVEDQPPLRQFAVTGLTMAGYTVLPAGDGATAVRLAAAHPGPIHLLLTDLSLPDADGREVADQVRAIRPGVVVLFMSGSAEADLSGRGPPEAGTNFLPKPFGLRQLARKVQEVLDRAEAMPAGA